MAATQKKKQQEAPAPQVEARIDRIIVYQIINSLGALF